MWLLEAATNFWLVFNKSATIARQGGWVQLEQSNMRLVLNMAQMSKAGFSRSTIEETQYQIEKRHTEVQQEQKRGVEFPED